MTVPPIAVGSQKQLFIDHKFIELEQGITLCANPALKAEAVLRPETAVESHNIGSCQVIAMGKEWWMYYSAVPLGNMQYDPSRKDGAGYMVCLAVSPDGRNWRRRNVNLYDVRGKENNVVIPNCYGSLLVDPKMTDGYRYWFPANMKQTSVWRQADGCDWTSGLYLLKSKDGIHFVRQPGQALPFYMDSMNECLYDQRLRKYVAYLRSWVPGKNRCVSRLEFDDLLSLPWPHQPMDPNRSRLMINTLIDEIPVVMQAEPGDPPGMDLYTSCVHIYGKGSDAVYLAFPSRYRHYDGFKSYGRDERDRYENNGVTDIALAVSRDGVHWTRFPQAYMGLGRIGEVDGGCHYMGLGMIPQGDELWMYGSVRADRAAYYRQEERCGAIIRLVQRLDGFVSADAGPQDGTLTTPVIIFQGTRLTLNIDCGAMGEAWVELQDPEGKPLPGFSLATSVSVDRNGVAQEVWWQQGPDVSPLAGRPVRLHIKMRSAKLYAFQFVRK